LGHSSDVITREIYTHLFDADTARHAKDMAAGGCPVSTVLATPATVIALRSFA
jgi:diacylglycerol kinase